ncbi:fructosamine kinase PKL/CAK/FruK [Fomitopsis serialis]|uniref:fructosamine kinase PKL/CAK/FruK n=1 Tax=Fomitopsis serialis TaxID=139415 RepID=UPI002007CF6F|nr:fructosamine kinase PKL/CAK/FruK [Neoantrodia serialis]KAH9937300.1 fructosamine kinase PKL/CAK/FruK [Neoantrodia serialis]
MVHPFASFHRLAKQTTMPPSVHKVFVQAIQKAEPGVSVSPSSSPPIQSSSGQGYIGKIGAPSDGEQFNGEAESLRGINTAAPGLAPTLLAAGIFDEETAENDSEIGKPYFLCEYKHIDTLTDNAAKALGKRLATEVPTFCGQTKQANGWFDSWEECFDALVGSLFDTLEGGEAMKHSASRSGNTGTDKKTGQPVIFDPSSYYGHNEADLAIARIFGGIPKSFFKTYHEYLPKSEPEDQYELRGDLYELYHYLNHTVLFGGSYASSAQQKLNRLLKAIP